MTNCQYSDTCPNKTDTCQEDNFMTTVKVIIPNKSWLIENQGEKLGTLQKEKSGFTILNNGQKHEVGNAKNVLEVLGIDMTELVKIKKLPTVKEATNTVYDFPCSSKPYNPVYNVRKKLPIYAKSTKSKSQYWRRESDSNARFSALQAAP